MGTDYDLRYVHKKTQEIFQVKRLIPGYYSVRHQLTGEKETITRSKLNREYEFQEKVSMENVRTRTDIKVLFA